MHVETLQPPLGGETFCEWQDRAGNQIILTFNDLWMIIVCRVWMEGSWVKTRHATRYVVDMVGKTQLADRLWEIEHAFGGLPEIPQTMQALHLERAYMWFKTRPVVCLKRW